MTALLPAHLTEALKSLGDAARGLADEVREDRKERELAARAALRSQQKQTHRIMMLLAVVAVLVAGLATLSISNRLLGQSNAQLNRQNARIMERIESCTTAGGECYEQNQKRTAGIVAVIIRGGVYAQLCLRDHPDASDAQIEACALDRAKAAAARDEPEPSGLGPSGEPVPGTPEPRPSG